MSELPLTTPALRDDALGIGNMTLHFATWGSKTTPERAVVLVHGLTASSREFLYLGPELAARGWYVIAPDLRGRGLSSKPPYGYGTPFHASDILTLCDYLGLPSFNIVGHSLGVFIGAFIAAVHPTRVRKLVMVDAGGVIPEDTQQAIAASVNRLGASFPSLDAYLGLMSQLPMLRWNALWDAYFRYDAETQPDGTVKSRVPRSAIEEENFVTLALRTEEFPRLVKQPTLVARAALGTLGPDKGIVLPREEAERLRQVMADCRTVEIPDTNHYTIVQSPELLRAVADFLAEG